MLPLPEPPLPQDHLSSRSRAFFVIYVAAVATLVSILLLVFHDTSSSILRLSVPSTIALSIAVLVVSIGVLLNYYLRSQLFYFRLSGFGFDERFISMVNNRLMNDLENKFDSKKDEPVFSSQLDILTDLAIAKQLYDLKYGQCFESLYSSETKIMGQMSRITRNANLNLIIGIMTTVLALGVLVYAVYQQRAFTTHIDLIAYYVPRISLVLFMEVFSFFFLRLYRSNLDDVKYFENELTNIDMRIAALKTTLLMENKDDLTKVVEILVETERNIILKKGESTINLEREKIQSREESALVDALKEITGKVKLPEVKIFKK